MLKITNENYEHYRKVLEVMFSFIWREHPFFTESDISPVRLLQKQENKNKSKARAGLRIALLDLMTMIRQDIPEEDKLDLHKKLLEEKLPGLWELLSIVNGIPAKVLKRGKIRNLDEWYVIKEVIDDIDSDISVPDREKLNKIFIDFETIQKRSNG